MTHFQTIQELKRLHPEAKLLTPTRAKLQLPLGFFAVTIHAIEPTVRPRFVCEILSQRMINVKKHDLLSYPIGYFVANEWIVNGKVRPGRAWIEILPELKNFLKG